MPGKRRSTRGLDVVSREYIEGLTEKACCLRDRALVALLYLSGRRISEVVGRILKSKSGEVVDSYQGVKLKDFVVDSLAGRPVLKMRCRILKKGSVKKGLKIVYSTIDMKLDDSLTKYVLDYLQVRGKEAGPNSRAFDLTRQRAWQIMVELDPHIWNHWFRHQRFSHLSAVYDPYDLKEFAVWESVEPAADYVHRSPKRLLDKMDEADKIWAAQSK